MLFVIKDIASHSLHQDVNNNILKIYIHKDKGEFFAKTVKLKYPRQRKSVVADNTGIDYKEIHKINPNLHYLFDELDQLRQRNQIEIELKNKILDDLNYLKGKN